MYTWGRYDIMIRSSLTSNLIFITLAITDLMIMHYFSAFFASRIENVSNERVNAMLNQAFKVFLTKFYVFKSSSLQNQNYNDTCWYHFERLPLKITSDYFVSHEIDKVIFHEVLKFA